MILFISDFGGSLPIVHRMRRAGEEVQIYIHRPAFRDSYSGILDKVELKDLKKSLDTAEKVVFDANVDLGVLGETLNGKAIANGMVLNRHENNLEAAELLAKEVGLRVKPNVKGVQLITEMWFDGEKAVLFTHSVPGQRWLTGDLGVKMGSQSNCLWVKKTRGVLTKELEALIPLLTSHGYIGPVSVDCTVNSKDKKTYFNSWRFGFRYDSIFCLLALLGSSITEFFTQAYMVRDDSFACSERLTIAPYPYTNEELLNSMAKDVRIGIDINAMDSFWGQDIKSENGEIRCVGNDGILGVIAATDKKIEEGFGKIYKTIRQLNIDAPLQFRIDGAKESNKKVRKLNDWKLSIN